MICYHDEALTIRRTEEADAPEGSGKRASRRSLISMC